MKRRISKILMLLFVATILFGCGNKVEAVRKRMEKHLYEKYGEEFVVDRIGTRSANGQKFYQAEIYPKSIIGTNKEGDSYYYGSASVDILSFGRLDKEAGDDYSYIKANDDIENYLLPKAKEIFGDRIRLKADGELEMTSPVTFDKTKPEDLFWAGYKASSFKEMKDKVKERPKTRRIVLNLYVYIFDRIETEEEKEKRREETFEFIEYLKKEGLFEYLEMKIVFIDERVLAPSYTTKYKYDLEYGEKIKEFIEVKNFYMPTKELRKEMKEKLGEELKNTSEKEMIENMNEFKKSELSYKGIEKYNRQYVSYIYSLELLKSEYKNDYEKEKENNNLKHYEYLDIKDLEIAGDYVYIYD